MKIKNPMLGILTVSVCLSGLVVGQSSAKGTREIAANEAKAVVGAPAPTVSKSDYVIGTDDILQISVWKEPELSQTVTVRPDGKITLPLIGDVTARGITSRQLEAKLDKKLETYVSDPAATVSVKESRSEKFNIVGEVQKPGAYIITGPVTVLDAISMAGGFREWAKQKKIYVLRNAGASSERLAFNYKDVIKGRHIEENIQLRPADTVVVP